MCPFSFVLYFCIFCVCVDVFLQNTSWLCVLTNWLPIRAVWVCDLLANLISDAILFHDNLCCRKSNKGFWHTNMLYWQLRTWKYWWWEEEKAKWQLIRLVQQWQLFRLEGQKRWHNSRSQQLLDVFLAWSSPRICLWGKQESNWV